MVIKRLLIVLGVALLFSAARASLPMRRALTFPQEKEQSITVYREGNGHRTFYTTADGVALVRQADGLFYYAMAVGDSLQATGVLAHNEASRSAMEQQFVAGLNCSRQTVYSLSYKATNNSTDYRSLTTSTSDGLGTYGVSAGGSQSSIGEHDIPVILVEFADLSFQSSDPVDKFARWFNEEGYSDEAEAVGSVADYFKAQSYGLFVPYFVVLGRVKVAYDFAYYGANSINSTDVRRSQFIREVIDSATTAGVDFSPYMVNGMVGNLVILYAGEGEQCSFADKAEDYLWALQVPLSYTSSTGIYFSNCVICNETFADYTYNSTAETYLKSNERTQGIGVMVHEFCHLLGLPDLYDTQGTYSVETPSFWSLMDYGEYTLAGYRPTELTAYERSYLGWLNVVEAGDEAVLCRLAPLGSASLDSTKAYLLRNGETDTEYYLLENKQESTWYPSELFGTGMMITHIYFSRTAWKYNTVNTEPTLPRYHVEYADNTYQSQYTMISWEEYQGDLFPGLSGNTSFTDTTTPYSSLYSHSTGKLEKPIYNITEDEDGFITFAYLEADPTSIENIPTLSPEDRVDVYNIDGRLVLSKQQLSRVSGLLRRGVYLIEGEGNKRKVYIDK